MFTFLTKPLVQVVAAVGAILVILTLWFRGEAFRSERDMALRDVAVYEAQVEQLVEGYGNVLNSFDAVVQDIAANQKSLNEIRKKLYNAPASSACVDSPPIRAVIDGLRERTDTNTASGD